MSESHVGGSAALIVRAGTDLPLTKKGPAAAKVLAGGDLSEIFGLEMAQDAQPAAEPPKKKVKPKRGKMPVGRKTKAAAPRRSKARKGSEPRAGRRP